MRTHTTPHLVFLAMPPSLPHCLTILQFTRNNTLSQAVESPVEVVADADERLVPYVTNLFERIALIEMQAEGFPLVGGQAFDQFPPTDPAKEPLARPVVSGHRRGHDFVGFHFAKFGRSVVGASIQVIPSVERFIVARLHDPAPGGAS